MHLQRKPLDGRRRRQIPGGWASLGTVTGGGNQRARTVKDFTNNFSETGNWDGRGGLGEFTVGVKEQQGSTRLAHTGTFWGKKLKNQTTYNAFIRSRGRA